MIHYGYIRFRSEEDKEDRFESYQNELLNMEIEEQNIYWDIHHYWEELPIFERLIENILKPKDILYIPRLRHVGKSLVDFLKVQQDLKDKDILLVILELPSPEDLIFQHRLQEAFSEIAQKEAEQRIRRQKRGIEEAKKKGIIGRKTKMTAENVHKIYKLKQENVSVLEISRKIQCSPATIYRVLRQEFDYPSEAGISILKDD